MEFFLDIWEKQIYNGNMKRTAFWCIFLVFLSAFSLLSCSSGGGSGSVAGGENVNNTAPAQDALNNAVLDEMNFARTKPKEYVKERLQPLLSSYTGIELAAVNELISEMNTMSALPAYTWGDGLYKAAKEWVDVQGPKGETGHDSNWSGRIKKYCSCSSAAENIMYGYNEAAFIVIGLLADANVEGRGHRKNILSSTYTHAGVATGIHNYYKYMCCIDFAGDYSEK